jgi:opacity protein-like surface antigen
MKLTNLGLLTIAIVAPAMAQNSDVGVLFNAVRTRFNFGTRVETQYRIGVQANYARQVLEGRGGRLYIEVPISSFRGPVGQGVIAAIGDGLSQISRPEGVIFVTPGVRYHFNLKPRLAVYAGVGGGIALRQQKFFLASPRPDSSLAVDVISQHSDWKVSGAFDFGAGLDFRLTRLLSLRGEVRSFRTSSQPGFGDGRQYPSAHVGLAFHF